MNSEDVKLSSKKDKLRPRPTDLEDIEDLTKPKVKVSSKSSKDKELENSTPNRKIDKLSGDKSANKTSKRQMTSKSRCRVRSDLKQKATPLVENDGSEDIAQVHQTEKVKVTEISLKKLELANTQHENTNANVLCEIEKANEATEETSADVVEAHVNDEDIEEEAKVLEGRPITESTEQGQQELAKEEDLCQDEQKDQKDKILCGGIEENSGEGEKAIGLAKPEDDIVITNLVEAPVSTEVQLILPTVEVSQEEAIVNINEGK
jgi:hypothetical protein